MKRIDFYQKKKALHEEMLGAIVCQFGRASIDEIDFMPEGEWQRNCYVVISQDGAESTREEQVRKIRFNDGCVEIMLVGEDDWISCEFAGDVVSCTLDDLYDAVADFFDDLNFVYYVCDLDENGKPTGKVSKETWRLGYADMMKEQRGHIYNDLQTALLHAQYDKS